MIKEYHFYISDNRTHDTHFVQHCIEKNFYDSLKSHKLNSMNIGYGWMDVQDNLNLRNHFLVMSTS